MPTLPVRENASLIERIASPVRVFAEHKLAGAGLLIAATITALIWANTPWGHTYVALLATRLTVGLGDFVISKPVQLWINDGLMGVFFFVVGLEIKREFLAGELSKLRNALLPISAAVGGMIAPALIFYAFNAGAESVNGWAIPMATDIAFCLGMLALLGDRVPASLKVFLTALAIVDDIGAIAVIALFYTDSISMLTLGLGGVVLIISMISNRVGVRSSVFYFLLGTLAWVAFLKSGVHATLAAVLMAFTIPARTRLIPALFTRRVNDIVTRFHEVGDEQEDKDAFLTPAQHHTLDELKDAMEEVLPPVQHLEHALVPLTTFFVLPVFALANAGVVLEPGLLSELDHPLAIGVIAGLFIGKQVGVFGFSWVATRVGIADLPDDITYRHVYGGAVLSGIGFTMSLFISGLAFDAPLLGEVSKMSILVASLLAAGWGWVVLRFWAPGPATSAAPQTHP